MPPTLDLEYVCVCMWQWPLCVQLGMVPSGLCGVAEEVNMCLEDSDI